MDMDILIDMVIAMIMITIYSIYLIIIYNANVNKYVIKHKKIIEYS